MAKDSTPPRSLFDSKSSAPREPATCGALERREFLKVAGAGAGLLLLGGCAPAANPEVPGIQPKRRFPLIGRSSPDIIVIGAGAWGGWTALNLRQMGAK